MKSAICTIGILASVFTSIAGAATTFNLHQESFLSPDFGPNVGRDYFFAGLLLQTDRSALDGQPGSPEKVESMVFKMDVRAEVSNAIEASYLNPREFYLRSGEISLGRKRVKWSSTDEQWHLGLFQPQS